MVLCDKDKIAKPGIDSIQKRAPCEPIERHNRVGMQIIKSVFPVVRFFKLNDMLLLLSCNSFWSIRATT